MSLVALCRRMRRRERPDASLWFDTFSSGSEGPQWSKSDSQMLNLDTFITMTLDMSPGFNICSECENMANTRDGAA